MASSKALLLFGLAFAIFVLTAEVSARELADTTQTKEGVNTDAYGSFGKSGSGFKGYGKSGKSRGGHHHHSVTVNTDGAYGSFGKSGSGFKGYTKSGKSSHGGHNGGKGATEGN